MVYELGVLLPLVVWGQQSSSDPVLLLRDLGIGGLGATIMYLWLRDKSKTLDRALDFIEQIRPLLMDLQHGMEMSAEAHKAQVESNARVVEVMKEFPAPRVWFSIEEALRVQGRKARE